MIVKLYSSIESSKQAESIKSFGLPVQGLIDGSFYCEQEFQTQKEAVRFMLKRAELLIKDKKELREVKQIIKKHKLFRCGCALLKMKKVNNKKVLV